MLSINLSISTLIPLPVHLTIHLLMLLGVVGWVIHPHQRVPSCSDFWMSYGFQNTIYPSKLGLRMGVHLGSLGQHAGRNAKAHV